jgi:hypothetical protein
MRFVSVLWSIIGVIFGLYTKRLFYPSTPFRANTAARLSNAGRAKARLRHYYFKRLEQTDALI